MSKYVDMWDKDIKWDIKKIHQELSNTYKRQMEIKKEFPHRFEWPSEKVFPWGQAWRDEMVRRKPWQKAREEFAELSSRMTALCCLINHVKGKLHMTTYDGEAFDKEAQAAHAEYYLYVKDFMIKEEKEVLVQKCPTPEQEPRKKGIISRFVGALGL